MASPKTAMSGKICLVTGATSGIGKATAIGLARLGAAVIVAGRDPEKCQHTAQWIKSETGNDLTDFLTADLCSQKEIRLMANRIHERYTNLDVLINNAGAKFASRHQTDDGHEMTFALNYLSGFLLTGLLLDLLKKNGGARVINVSSSAHHTCPGIRFDDLHGRKSYCGKQAYAQSKLAVVLFTYSLAGRLKTSGITVNAVHPGAAATGFSRNNGAWGWIKHVLAHVLAGNLISPASAARTVLYLAASPGVEGVTGQYFIKGKSAFSSPASYNKEAARQLWDTSTELTHTDFI